MTTLREAAQMALNALEQVQEADTAGATPKMVMEARKLYEPTITALLAALAQPEQEPVAWMFPDDLERFQTSETFAQAFSVACGSPTQGKTLPLYTAPPQRERILCGCGDQIMPDDGAECGTCVTARNATQREWQGLTDEERQECLYSDPIFGMAASTFARAIEAKLKEKNGAI